MSDLHITPAFVSLKTKFKHEGKKCGAPGAKLVRKRRFAKNTVAALYGLFHSGSTNGMQVKRAAGTFRP
jgi:hypothetical protein